MKHTTIILAFLMAISTQVNAADPDDLRKLKDTGECIKCDLRNADLRGADFSRANLSESNLKDSNFKKLDDILGIYYFNPKGISTNTENNSWKQDEERNVFMKYMKILKEENK